MAAPKNRLTFTITPAPKKPAPAVDVPVALRESLTLLQRGENAKAQKILQGVLAAQPEHAEALHLLGVIAVQGGQPKAAVELFRRALAADPGHAIACSNLGLALSRLNRDEEALAQYERAIALKPDFADAHSNRGVTLNKLQRYPEAVAAYDRAIALFPAFTDAWRNRGVALSNQNRHVDAIASYDRALALKPAEASIRWNRCLARLLTGDFAGGWEDSTWRWKKHAAAARESGEWPFWHGNARRHGKTNLPHGVPCAFDPPFWDGTPTKGSLLVWPEQGVGEQVLLASMLDEARARVGQLTLILDPKLHALFRRSFPECRIVTLETAHAENNFDWQIPMGDLGVIFRRNKDDFLRRRKAYLKADPARTAILRKAIAPGRKRICGLSWFSRNDEFGAQKTLALDALRPLLEMPGLRFVDLQYGDTEKERAAISKDSGIDIQRISSVDPWQDIDGLAALVEACDIIVTISNSTAHIAGALGKEVLLLLPHAQGRFWYWQTNRDDTLWYPNVRVFWQRTAGDWAETVERVRAALAASSAAPKPGKR